MTRVWLPDPPAAFGGLPAGIEADVWRGGEDLPPSADEVELVVFPHKTNPEILRTIRRCRSSGSSRSSRGAEHILPYIPAGITLCNASACRARGPSSDIRGGSPARASFRGSPPSRRPETLRPASSDLPSRGRGRFADHRLRLDTASKTPASCTQAGTKS